MTDNPMDKIEAVETVSSLAALTWEFHSALRSLGFQHHEAYDLTEVWLEGMMRGIGQGLRTND